MQNIWEHMTVRHAVDKLEIDAVPEVLDFIKQEQRMRILEALSDELALHVGPVVVMPFTVKETIDEDLYPNRVIIDTKMSFKEIGTCYNCEWLDENGVCKLTKRNKRAGAFCDEWVRAKKGVED